MSKFIMGAAMILFLLYFPMQYVINQINHNYMEGVRIIVTKHSQQARTDGYFTPANLDTMKTEIAQKANLTVADINVIATTTPKYRLDAFDKREMIDYEVHVPITRILAMNSFFGFTDAQNQFDYVLKDAVASEVLAP